MSPDQIKEALANISKGARVTCTFFLSTDGVVPRNTPTTWCGEVRSVQHGKIWMLWDQEMARPPTEREVWQFPFEGQQITAIAKTDRSIPSAQTKAFIINDDEEDADNADTRRSQKKGRSESLEETVMKLTETQNSLATSLGEVFKTLKQMADGTNGRESKDMQQAAAIGPTSTEHPLRSAQAEFLSGGAAPANNTDELRSARPIKKPTFITKESMIIEEECHTKKESELAEALLTKSTRKTLSLCDGLRVPANVDSPLSALYPNLWDQSKLHEWKTTYLELLLHLGVQVQSQQVREEYELSRDTLFRLLSGPEPKTKAEWKIPFGHASNIVRILVLTTMGANAAQKCRTKLAEQWIDGRVDFESALRTNYGASAETENQQSSALNHQFHLLQKSQEQINQLMHMQTARGRSRGRSRGGYFRGGQREHD